MKIVHLTTVHTATDNRIVRKECRSAVLAGNEVKLVAAYHPGFNEPGVELIPLPKRGSRLTRFVLGVPHAVQKTISQRPDIIHFHDPELIPALMALRIILGSRTRVIYDAHEDLAGQVSGKDYIPKWAKRGTSIFAKILVKSADIFFDGIVAATPVIASKFKNPRKVIVQNFPWPSDFGEPELVGRRQSGALSYVGWLDRQRGSAEICKALSIANGDLRLIRAGNLSAEAEYDLALAAEYVDDRGLVDAESVPFIVSSGAAGLVLFHPNPNNLESQPTKMYEYMASARPFIASDFSYWRAAVGRFNCALFVDPLDPEAIAKAMGILASDWELSREMGNRGRRAFLDHFSFEKEADKLVEFYQSFDLSNARGK